MAMLNMTGKHGVFWVVFITIFMWTFEKHFILVAELMCNEILLGLEVVSTLKTFYFLNCSKICFVAILELTVRINFDVVPVQAYIRFEYEVLLVYIARAVFIFYVCGHVLNEIEASRYFIFKSEFNIITFRLFYHTILNLYNLYLLDWSTRFKIDDYHGFLLVGSLGLTVVCLLKLILEPRWLCPLTYVCILGAHSCFGALDIFIIYCHLFYHFKII